MNDEFPFGTRTGSLQEEALFDSLARRARPGERPEELLFDLRLVDEHDYAHELAARSGRQFTGLRGFQADARLFAYIPLPIAMRERLCPLVIVGDSMKVASAFVDPDLSYLQRRFPSLQVELAIAPRTEIIEALNRVAESL